MNFGSYILLACFASFVAVIILYILKGRKALDKEFKDLEKIKEQVPLPSNPPKGEKPVDKEKLDYDILMKQQQPSNVQKDIVITDDDLNSASYAEALKQGTTTFGQ